MDPRIEVVKEVIDASRRYALGHPSGRGLWVAAEDLAYDILAALDALPSVGQGDDELREAALRAVATISSRLDSLAFAAPQMFPTHLNMIAFAVNELDVALAASPERQEGR